MWFYFSILLLGGPSPPSQLVPKQLKTVLPCKALGFSYGLITAVVVGGESLSEVYFLSSLGIPVDRTRSTTKKTTATSTTSFALME